MLIATGRFVTSPELASELLADLQAGAAHVSEAEGCLFYAFGMEDAAEGKVLVSEIWADEPALQRHVARPHMAAFIARWGSRMRIEVTIYDAGNPRHL